MIVAANGGTSCHATEVDLANPLTMKLEQFTAFDAAERKRLDQLIAKPPRIYPRGRAILRDGDKIDAVVLVMHGLAARSKTLRDGNRQTMAFLVPGDLCDVEVFVLDAMDHDIIAVSETTCVHIPAEEMKELLSQSSAITKALWWSTMTDSAVLRERIIDHGSRSARERIAHLLCELLVRNRVAGQTSDNTFLFPLTQEQLAEATGLTAVHVNRTVQQLRGDGLIQWQDKVMIVPDPAALMHAGQFDARYLHLIRTQKRDPAIAGRAEDLVGPT